MYTKIVIGTAFKTLNKVKMKQKFLAATILVASFSMYSCKKETVEKEQSNLPATKVDNRYSTNSSTVSFMTKTDLINSLTSNGYTIISSVPSNLVSEFTLNPGTIPSSVTYLTKQIGGMDYYYGVYSFPDVGKAKEGNEKNNCTQDWHADKDSEGCFDSGNECSVKITDESKGIVKIICCD